MANLTDAVETEFETDFAILRASQAVGDAFPGLPSFAVSIPGNISMLCGDKYARIRVRAERWDARPPAADQWENSDELPFEEVPGAGALVLGGFDDSDVGLDVSGLGRGRAQVFARGRRAFDHNEDTDLSALPQEEWLIRVYPSEGPIDPMAGGARRIAGGGLRFRAETPWGAAARAFTSSGWSHALLGSKGAHLAEYGLLRAAAPLTRTDLAVQMIQQMHPPQPVGPDPESFALPQPTHVPRDDDSLAVLTGRTSIATIGDAIDAVLELGLVLIENRAGVELLIPNPSPLNAWEHEGIKGSRGPWLRKYGLESEHRDVAKDISMAVHWLHPGALTATPYSMSIRWSTSVSDVIGGIRLLGGTGYVSSDRELGFDVDLGEDESIALRQGPNWRFE